MSHYLGIAAADGMAPLLPAIGSLLAAEPASHVTLVYGNETSSAVPLRAELLRLKDRYLARLALIFVMSRERQDVDAFNGSIDRAKVEQLLQRWIDVRSVDTAFISGPDAMTRDVQVALADAGLDAARIVAGAPGATFSLSLDNARDDKGGVAADRQPWAAVAADRAPWAGVAADRRPWAGVVADRQTSVAERDDVVHVKLVFEGKQHAFDMLRGEPILDAALRAGIDVPYSCRSGVCGTCRATLTAGKVDIEVNYALEDDEIARGAILMCQSHPLTPEVTVEVREF